MFVQERLAGVYQELGSETLESIPFTVLIEHPVIQDIVSSLNTYKALVSYYHIHRLITNAITNAL